MLSLIGKETVIERDTRRFSGGWLYSVSWFGCWLQMCAQFANSLSYGFMMWGLACLYIIFEYLRKIFKYVLSSVCFGTALHSLAGHLDLPLLLTYPRWHLRNNSCLTYIFFRLLTREDSMSLSL